MLSRAATSVRAITQTLSPMPRANSKATAIQAGNRRVGGHTDPGGGATVASMQSTCESEMPLRPAARLGIVGGWAGPVNAEWRARCSGAPEHDEERANERSTRSL